MMRILRYHFQPADYLKRPSVKVSNSSHDGGNKDGKRIRPHKGPNASRGIGSDIQRDSSGVAARDIKVPFPDDEARWIDSYERKQRKAEQRWLSTYEKRQREKSAGPFSESSCSSCRVAPFPLSSPSHTDMNNHKNGPRIVGRAGTKQYQHKHKRRMESPSASPGQNRHRKTATAGAAAPVAIRPLMVTRALSAIHFENEVKCTPDELAALYFKPVKNRTDLIKVDKGAIERLSTKLRPKHFVPKRYRESGHRIEEANVKEKKQKKPRIQPRSAPSQTRSKSLEKEAPDWWLKLYGYTSQGHEETKRRSKIRVLLRLVPPSQKLVQR